MLGVGAMAVQNVLVQLSLRGAALGAACYAAAGLVSLAVPAGSALLALAIGLVSRSDGGRRRGAER
jgi:hypothetical protein